MSFLSRQSLRNVIKYGLGVVFLVSGIAKLFPIHSFEFLIVTQKLADWMVSPYLARGIIIVELLLGVGFLQNNYLRKLIIPVSFLLLIVFNIHLVYTIITSVGVGNCGCFGELIPMTPLEALIKNIIMMLALIYLFFYEKIIDKEEPKNLLISLPLITAFIFIAFPVKQYVVPEEESKSEVQKYDDSLAVDPFNLDEKKPQPVSNINSERISPQSTTLSEDVPLLPKKKSIFSSYKNFSNGVKANLDEGEKIVAIFSLDCDHCMETAKKFAEMKNGKNFPDVYILFYGEREQVNPFFDFAGKEFPFIILSAEEFFPLLNASPPRVVLLNNGSTIADLDHTANVIVELKKKLK